MSRTPFLISVYLLSALIWTSGYAADESDSEDSNKNSEDTFEEFVGIDMADKTKEELIPPLKDFELPEEGPLQVAVIPLKTDIGPPSLFLLRRSVKEAIEAGAHVVVLDMDTPGGRLDSTLEMMEILNEFSGITVTFINDEAISAGAIISSVTDYIYFAPLGIMGAAAAVASSGQDIPETMQAKIKSYLDARIESYGQDKRLRNKVIKAMMDTEFEFVEDGILISPKGELLGLTASKAVVPFGDPPEPLVAAGIAESVEEIFKYGFGTEDIVITEYEASWSEEFAAVLGFLTPVLFGIGIVMLVVEIKTPSFGLLGLIGLSLILIATFGHNVAGLAGFEAILLLLGGVVLVAVELFFLPGTLIFGFAGVVCILGAMVWSFADVWPVVPEPGHEPTDWKLNTDSLEAGVVNLAISLVIAIVVLMVIWRFLPKSSFFKRVVVESSVADPSPVIAGGGRYVEGAALPDIGAEGVVVSDLHPVGVVEIDGKRFEATTSIGEYRKGDKILVVGYKSYSLLVDRKP
jgi:membrane-bound serine protease (ClpP class)